MADLDLNATGMQFQKIMNEIYTAKDSVPLLKICKIQNQETDTFAIDLVDEIKDDAAIKGEYKRTANTNIKKLYDKGSEADFYKTPLRVIGNQRIINKVRSFFDAILITEYDNIRLAADPTSSYIASFKRFMEKQYNKVIFSAIAGNMTMSQTDINGIVSQIDVELPEEQKVVVSIPASEANDKIKLAEKILEAYRKAKLKFDINYVFDTDRYFICGAELRDVMRDIDKVSNSLYSSAYVAKYGKDLDELLGIKFITQENATNIPFSEDSIASDTYNIGMLIQKESIFLGKHGDIKTSINARPDLKNDTQCAISFHMNATRQNNKGVVQLILKVV